METRKFQLFQKGHIIGLIFISDNHPNFPNCKVGTILPFKIEGEWTNNDLKIIGQDTVTDIFELDITDDTVKQELANRIDFYPENISESDFQEY
jgi:hypothetical protein